MAGNSNFWTRQSPFLLSILRIVVGFLFMQHGGEKLLGFPGGNHLDLISPDKMLTLVPGLAGILELGGGFLVLIGLFTRPVAFIVSGEMAFAYFMAHFPHNHVFPLLNGGGMAVAFCFVFLYLSAAGPGPWSVDRARGRA
ncbi:MAG: DoxX family protein [Rhodanobacteraceae bacterium]|nr:MAG: DoxX family protein [Rhodanobacteraceae bacterium]